MIAPILFGIGVQLDKSFGRKWFWVAKNVDHNIRTLTVLSAILVKTTPYDGSSFNGFLNIKLKPVKDLTLQTIHAPEANLEQVQV